MVDRCRPLAAAMGANTEFVSEIAHRLCGVEGSIVLKNLLYILKGVLDAGAVPASVVSDNGFQAIVGRLAERQGLVLVTSLAQQVLLLLRERYRV